jgi:hypothetical protein
MFKYLLFSIAVTAASCPDEAICVSKEGKGQVYHWPPIKILQSLMFLVFLFIF